VILVGSDVPGIGELPLTALTSSAHAGLVTCADSATQAQLVFSTHETQLLGTLMADTPVLERDQVWFVEKDNVGATSVYSLTDFSPRRQENLERGYLQGRYGAVPFFDNSEELVGTISTAESGD
jgi:AAA15 family ATPase/GTPase